MSEPDSIAVRRPTWVWIGLGSALLLLPALHLAAVDLESKQPAEFVASASGRHLSITLAGSLGMLVTVGVLAAIFGIRTLAPVRRQYLADVLTAIGYLGIVGLFLSFLGSILAAEAAKQEYPYEVIRSFGMIADGAGPVMWATFAGPAVLVAVLGIADRVLSRSLGWISVFFAVVMAGLGLVAPGSAALPTLVWYVTCMVFLAIRGVRSA